MVPGESSMSDVLDTQSIVRVVLVFGRLDVDSSLRTLDTTRLRIFDDGTIPGPGLHVRLKVGSALELAHGSVILGLMKIKPK